MPSLEQVTGPNGEIALYDRTATQAAYSSFGGNSCTCSGCRNFRSAFDPALMDAGLRDMCATIGVDPFKAVETTFYDMDPTSGLAVYSGECLFVGRLTQRVIVYTSFWGFTDPSVPQDDFGDSQAALHFSVLLPWTLSEPPSK